MKWACNTHERFELKEKQISTVYTFTCVLAENDDDLFLIGTDDGTLLSYDGDLRILAVFVEGSITRIARVDKNKVIVHAGNVLHCLNVDYGLVRTVFKGGDSISSFCVIKQSLLYVATGEGAVHMVQLDNDDITTLLHLEREPFQLYAFDEHVLIHSNDKLKNLLGGAQVKIPTGLVWIDPTNGVEYFYNKDIQVCFTETETYTLPSRGFEKLKCYNRSTLAVIQTSDNKLSFWDVAKEELIREIQVDGGDVVDFDLTGRTCVVLLVGGHLSAFKLCN